MPYGATSMRRAVQSPVARVDDADVERVVVGRVDLPAVARDVDVEGTATDRDHPGHLPPYRVDDLQGALAAGDVDPDVGTAAVGGQGDAHAAAPVLAGRHRARVRPVADEGGALARTGVHGGHALRGRHPRRAVLAQRDPVRRRPDPHRAQVGRRAPPGGVDEGDGVGAEVRDQQRASGGACRGAAGVGCALGRGAGRGGHRGRGPVVAVRRASAQCRGDGGQRGEAAREGTPVHRPPPSARGSSPCDSARRSRSAMASKPLRSAWARAVTPSPSGSEGSAPAASRAATTSW